MLSHNDRGVHALVIRNIITQNYCGHEVSRPNSWPRRAFVTSALYYNDNIKMFILVYICYHGKCHVSVPGDADLPIQCLWQWRNPQEAKCPAFCSQVALRHNSQFSECCQLIVMDQPGIWCMVVWFVFFSFLFLDFRHKRWDGGREIKTLYSLLLVYFS